MCVSTMKRIWEENDDLIGRNIDKLENWLDEDGYKPISIVLSEM